MKDHIRPQNTDPPPLVETISEDKSQALKQLASNMQDLVNRDQITALCPTETQTEKTKYAPQAKCMFPQMATFKYLKFCPSEEILEFPKSVYRKETLANLKFL